MPENTSGAAQGGGTNRFVYVAAAISAMGGLLFGYDTGIISGALLFIADDFALSDNLQQAVVGALLLGAVLGALGGGPLSDRLGRRRSILVAAVVFAFADAVGLAVDARPGPGSGGGSACRHGVLAGEPALADRAKQARRGPLDPRTYRGPGRGRG